MRVPEIIEIELGEPWKLRENGAALAIPLLIRERGKGERRYRLLSEVGDQVRLVDTGRIDRLQVVNGSQDTVFIRKGSIVKGDTQTRALTLSIAVAPMSKTQAEIKCVYASKGIRSGTNFEFSGKITPVAVTESLRESQGATWNKVHEYTTAKKLVESMEIPSLHSAMRLNELNRRRGTDDLEGYLTAEEGVIDEAMKNVPVDHARQVGLAVVDFDGIAGLEMFDHPDSWRALSMSVTRNYAEILARMASDVFEVNMEKVRRLVSSFVVELQSMEGESAYKEGRIETYEIREKRFTGEFTTMEGSLIHILVSRNESRISPSPDKPVMRRNIGLVDARLWQNRMVINEFSAAPTLDKSYEVLDYNQEQSKQVNAAGIVEYLTKKRGYGTIIALREGPKTFNELHDRTRMSTATITKALRDAEDLGIVQRSYRPDSGSTVYELTESGRTLVPEKFKAASMD
jgi:DNA-binding HxlR family transcriptional regulator